jgi:hypothetical protein
MACPFADDEHGTCFPTARRASQSYTRLAVLSNAMARVMAGAGIGSDVALLVSSEHVAWGAASGNRVLTFAPCRCCALRVEWLRERCGAHYSARVLSALHMSY